MSLRGRPHPGSKPQACFQTSMLHTRPGSMVNETGAPAPPSDSNHAGVGKGIAVPAAKDYIPLDGSLGGPRDPRSWPHNGGAARLPHGGQENEHFYNRTKRKRENHSQQLQHQQHQQLHPAAAMGHPRPLNVKQQNQLESRPRSGGGSTGATTTASTTIPNPSAHVRTNPYYSDSATPQGRPVSHPHPYSQPRTSHHATHDPPRVSSHNSHSRTAHASDPKSSGGDLSPPPPPPWMGPERTEYLPGVLG